MPRLGPKRAFLVGPRRPAVFFYTTSTDKFLQARFVLDRAGIPLREFRSKRDPYAESEDGTSDELLRAAISEILQTIGSASFFFVEDTSVVIDALSSMEDVPGLGVKEWFRRTSFEHLDAQLRALGNNRQAVVRSDIGLHVPGLDRILRFHGETVGSVALSAPDYKRNVQHPWLSPESFNGWFVPDGASKTLGEMPLEESLRHDFRVRALLQLVDRLEEFTAAVNTAGSAFERRRPGLRGVQASLFDGSRRGLVLIGPACAGKTTLAGRLSQHHGYTHIEASEIVRTFGELRSRESPASFARRILSDNGASAVAHRILDWYDDRLDQDYVVSGFRTMEELLSFRRAQPDAHVLAIEAGDRVRFERHVKRKRGPHGFTFEEFQRLDTEQSAFGLLPIAHQLADFRVGNERSLAEYIEIADHLAKGSGPATTPGVVENSLIGTRTQLRRCLEILDAAERPITPDEIERLSTIRHHRIDQSNANRTLKRFPAFAARAGTESDRIRYSITPAGQAYLQYVQEFGVNSVGPRE